MSRDAVIFGVAGTAFGLLLGWIIGSQQSPVVRTVPTTTAAAAGNSATPTAPNDQPPPLDLQRAAALEQQAKAQPSDAAVRAELGNLYLDAQRQDLAIPWYEASLKLNPKDVNVSTDLAKAYFETNQPDKALAQIDHSLAIDPKHSTTLLNQGIIRAFGKQDLDGALESWQKVLEYAPGTPDAARAKQGIEGLQSGHGSSGKTAPGGGRGGL
jgi:cytochrome c-type biogenesis protein CcmH/NrfG